MGEDEWVIQALGPLLLYLSISHKNIVQLAPYEHYTRMPYPGPRPNSTGTWKMFEQ